MASGPEFRSLKRGEENGNRRTTRLVDDGGEAELSGRVIVLDSGARTLFQTRLWTKAFGWKLTITDEDGSEVVTVHHENESTAWEMAMASLKRRGIV